MSRLWIKMAVWFVLMAQVATGVTVTRLSNVQAARLLDDIAELSCAADERVSAERVYSNLDFQSHSGPVTTIVQAIKSRIKGVAPYYLDVSWNRNGSYNEWFSLTYTNGRSLDAIKFPYWSISNLIAYVGAPADVLDKSNAEGWSLVSTSSVELAACRKIVSALKHLPVRNVEQTYQVERRARQVEERYDATWFDQGNCYSGCVTVTDTVIEGNPTSGKDAWVPTPDVVATQSLRQATWSIQHNATYSYREEQQMADYTGLWGSWRWDKTKTINEHYGVGYESVATVGAQIHIPKRCAWLSAVVKPYRVFMWTAQAPSTIEAVETTGCNPEMCELLDENDNVVKVYKCWATGVTTRVTYTLPGWDPALPRHYVSAGAGVIMPTGGGPYSVTIQLPDNPLGDSAPATIFMEDYECDTVTDPMGFGLANYGVVGSVSRVRQHAATIPMRSIVMDTSKVMMEAKFDHLP